MLYPIVESIEKLQKLIEEKPEICFFEEEAGVDEIMDLEDELGIIIPYSYKIFLNNFNGGFICNFAGKSEADYDSLKWNSLNLFSMEEIRYEYNRLSDMDWKIFGDNYDDYPFIPFCRTNAGELLIFVNPLDENIECPVFDAFHEEFPSDWGMLYKNFTDFFKAYVESEGQIKTTSYESPTAEEYLNSK